LLAHGWWFSLGTPASSTTKTGRHDIAEILLKVALKHHVRPSDYFLVSEDLYSLMKYTKIIPGYKTDHSAIIFTFATSLAKRGKGYWKFNSQLLRDTDYIKRVKTCITETISEYYLSGGECENNSRVVCFIPWNNFSILHK
jgi:hypothetical protein